MRNHLQPLRLPDQTGRTWLITGATNGLGRQVAQAASEAGARVIVAARDPHRGARVAAQLRDARVLVLDLADLTSVSRAAATLDEPVDVLVNNAGTVSATRRLTVDGFELMLGTNALGPFAFTNQILPMVRERVVIVGSGAHRWVEFDAADPHFERRRFSFTRGYGQSKLAGMLWGLALSNRLTGGAHRGSDPGLNHDDGAPRLGVQLAHPGWAETNLQNQTPWKVANAVVGVAARIGAQSAADAAQCILVAATRDLPECSYVGPSGRGELKGPPSLVGRSAHASNPEVADEFWMFAEAATGTGIPRLG